MKTNDLMKVFGNRSSIEGSVIYSCFKDTSLFDEWKLQEDDFLLEESKTLFTIGKIIAAKGVSKIDYTTLKTELTFQPELNEKLNEFGGAKYVIKQCEYVDVTNADLYFDNLLKNNYLLSLSKKGFDMSKYADKLKDANYEQTIDFVEVQVLNSDLTRGKTMRGVEVTDLYITDEARDHYFNGDMFETLSFHDTAPVLNNIVNGLPLKAMTMISSPSGGSKSTFITYNFIYSALKRGERVVLITNEMLYSAYEAMLISIVANDIFNEWSLTRDKLMKQVKTEKDREIFDKVRDYINTNFAKKLRVVFYTSGKRDVVLKTIRKESKLGCKLCIYDVMKADDSRGQAWQELIELSKSLDFACKENDVALVVTNQLTQTAIGLRCPTRANLSEGKDVIKVVSNHIIFRWLMPNEFTGETYDANFYTLRRNEQGKWERQPFTLKKEDNLHNRFLVAYVDKNRFGEDGQFVLFKFEGRYGTFKELCMCRPCPDVSFKK